MANEFIAKNGFISKGDSNTEGRILSGGTDIGTLLGGGGGDGNGIYDGSGTVPSSTNVTLTDNLNFDSGTLYIDGSSNEVGIGTTSPQDALHVSGATQTDIRIESADATVTALQIDNSVNSWRVINSAVGNFIIRDDTAGNNVFNIDPGASAQTIDITANQLVLNQNAEDVDLRVEGTGDDNLIRTDAANDRVGIGISTPSEKLHVVGDSLFSGTLSATTLFATNELWTVELVDTTVGSFYAPYNMVIESYTFPLSSTTIEIFDDGSTYTTGTTIAIGSKIVVSANTATVVNLNTTR